MYYMYKNKKTIISLKLLSRMPYLIQSFNAAVHI